MKPVSILAFIAVVACIGCGSSSPSTDGGTSDGGTSDGGGMTIAAARKGSVATPITVKGVVMAEAGVPGDFPQWYIEDPEGGPYSGVVVYCDPDLSATCKAIQPPGLGALVEITGTLSTYMGDLQLVPTAQTVLAASTTPPAPASVTMQDIAATSNSPYRGVYVKLSVDKLTVDSVAPQALWDTECTGTLATDGGTDGEPVAAGMLQECSSLCEPPAYSGFEVNDGQSNEAYIEAPFFNFDHLQSSPECLTQSGVTPVYVGGTFTAMAGILDVDPYSGKQAIYPTKDSDYTLQSAGTP